MKPLNLEKFQKKYLKKIFEEYKKNPKEYLALKLFPNLKFVSSVSTGQFSLYIPKAREFIGNEIDILSPVIGCSELGLTAFANSRNNQDFFLNMKVLYEFIPLENVDLNNQELVGDKRPLRMDEIKIGETYEIVAPNFSFRRIRMGDLIKVTKFRGIVPVLNLLEEEIQY